MSVVSACCGLAAGAFVLSVKTGMILGSSWLSNRGLLAISFLFGCLLFGLVWVFRSAQQVLISFLDNYTFAGAVVVAVFLIYLGLQGDAGRASSWPSGQKIQSEEARGLRPLSGRLKYALCFLPCPLCLLALALSVVLAGSVIGLGLPLLGGATAVLFSALVAGSGIGVRWLIRSTGYEPADVFNPLLLITGLLTLIFAFFVPNLVQAMNMPLEQVRLDLRWMLIVSGVLVAVGLCGFLSYQLRLKEGDE